VGVVSDPKNDLLTGPLDEPEQSEVFARDGARARPESAREAMTKTLLASARHELRSPLQSIQGFAELLGSESYGSLSEEQHAFVEHILQGSLELGSTLEACLELAELELFAPALDLALVDLRSELGDSIERASHTSGTAVQTRYGSGLQSARTRMDKATTRRAFTALLTGLGTGPGKVFRLIVEHEGEHARLTFSSPARASAGPYMTVDEFARRRHATRSLVWLRLASLLLEHQGGVLLVTEPLDCAEVRIRLSSTH
jgi:hypothetical protein